LTNLLRYPLEPLSFTYNKDDESGLCYDNDLGCGYDDLVFTNDMVVMIDVNIIMVVATAFLKRHFVALNLNYEYVRDYCFSNEDDCIIQLNVASA